MKRVCILAVILFAVSGTWALQQQIPLENAGFEAPAMGKIYTFDWGWYDVPGWNDVDWNNDSGVEGPYPWWTVHSGAYAAFFQGGNPGAYQMTGYTIQAGHVFIVGFWANNIWDASRFTITLFGDTIATPANELGSYTFTDFAGNNNNSYQYYEVVFTAPATVVGQELGIKFANTAGGWVGLDDVSIVAEIPPIILVSFSPEGTGVTNRPVLEAVIADGESQVDPASILLTLDDNPVTPNISKDGSLTTISYAVAEPLEALSIHTVRLVVAGMNPPSEPMTNQWSFVVIGSGEPRRVYVDATDGPDGNTRAWNPMTSMFVEWDLPLPWGDEYDWRWDMWDWLGNNNSVYWSSIYEDSPRLKTTATGMENGAYKVYAYCWSLDPSWGAMVDIQASLNNGTLLPYNHASENVVRHYLDIDPNDSYDYLSPVYSSSMSWNPFTSDVKIADGDARLLEIPLGTVSVTNGKLSVYIDDLYLKYENVWWGLSLYDGIGYEPLTVDPDTFVTGGGWIWSPPGALAKNYEFTDPLPAETTIAHWDFADPGAADGAFMPGNAELEDLDMDGGYDDDDFRISAMDLSGNGNHLTAPISYWMKWSSDSIQGDFSMQNGNFLPDVHTYSWFNPYLTGIDIESITPAQWTIEAVFKLEELAPYGTIVGRDGYFLGINPFGALAALYFSTRGSDLAIEYIDVGGFDHNLQVAANLEIDTWYRTAAVSDGSTLSLYLDGELIGSQDLTNGTETALAMGYGTWSVTRGMWAGEHTDRVHGLIDEVAISDAALTPETFVIQPYVPVLEGRANFGFNAKYKTGAVFPSGQAEFQFRAGGLNFHSSDYEWLQISGGEAILKGTGTINHIPGFGFMLTASDGGVIGKGVKDHVRIQIWDKMTGDTIYDNKADTVLQSGNIEIHAR